MFTKDFGMESCYRAFCPSKFHFWYFSVLEPTVMIHEADVLLSYYVYQTFTLSFLGAIQKNCTKFCHLRKITPNFSSCFIIHSGSVIICIHYMSSREERNREYLRSLIPN